MMMFAPWPASRWICSLIIPISSIVTSSPPETTSNRTFFAPMILLSFKSGESSAFATASSPRFGPEEVADPMIAVPLSANTVLASLRSIFCV